MIERKLKIIEGEFRAVLERFTPRVPVSGGKQMYEYCCLSTKIGSECSIAIVPSLEPGQTPAQSIARDVIDDLDPGWILLIGIAGGVPDDRFSLGDVLLASRLHDFSVSAAIEGRRVEFQQTGGPMDRKVERLLASLLAWSERLGDWNSESSIGRPKPSVNVPKRLNAKSLYGSTEMRRHVRDTLRLHFPANGTIRPPLYCVGPGATANVLMKDTELLSRWQESARHLTHIEMEAGGVYHAVHHSGRHDYPLLCVRGISDIVGFRRSSDWTVYACHAAAAFVHALIRSGAILIDEQTSASDDESTAGHQMKARNNRSVVAEHIVRSIISTGENATINVSQVAAPEANKSSFSPEDTLDLSFRSWRQERQTKRGDRQLVATHTAQQLASKFTGDSPVQVLLVGGIASGKSSIVEQVGLAFKDCHSRGETEEAEILVLPLTTDFRLPNGASRQEACKAFSSSLQARTAQNPLLLIVEDAHEAEGKTRFDWTGHIRDVSNVYLLVTSRDRKQDVERKIKESWNVEPMIVTTNPVETANALIKKRVLSWKLLDTRKQELVEELNEHFTGFMGKDLIMLEACLDRLQDNPDRPVSRDLAYEAVDAELDNLLQARDLQGLEKRLTVLVAWCFGGLELPLTFDVLEGGLNLGHEEFRDVLHLMVDRNELQREMTTNRFLSLRHPAWCRLVISAMRNSQRFHHLAEEIGKRVQSRYQEKVPAEQLEKVATDPLSCLLMLALFAKSKPLDELSLYCTAQYFSMPFAHALLAFVEAEKQRGQVSVDLSGELLVIADNLRRFNHPFREGLSRPAAWQENLREGWEHLQRAVEARKKLYGDELQSDPKRGFVLYQLGYYSSLAGRFEDALHYFRDSKNTDLTGCKFRSRRTRVD